METWLFFVKRIMPMRPIAGQKFARMCVDPQRFKWLITAADYDKVHKEAYTRIRAWGPEYSRFGAVLDAIQKSYNLTKLLGEIDEEIVVASRKDEDETQIDDPVPVVVRRLVDRRYAHLFES